MNDYKKIFDDAISMLESATKNLPKSFENIKDLKQNEAEILASAIKKYEQVMADVNKEMGELNKIFK